jgi:hypothetical protein
MKAFWIYRCDFGHVWMLLRDEDVPESPEDAICPLGHEAVTLEKARLLDMVQIAIRPAAQVVDTTTGQTGHEYEYYLVVTDLHRGVERMSRRPLTWSDAKAVLDRFRARPDKPGTMSPAEAWAVMDELDASSERHKPSSADPC